ncbi:MAG: hypothetical protein KDI12_02755, partial [Anaerolineae bacterium]|nr:hypothetical protein [Anaerolineae bacterium]
TGSVNIGGGSVSGSTGTAFLAQGTLGSTSYSGSIAKTSAGRLVDVGAGGSGTVTLSGNLSCTGSCGTGGGNHGLRVTGRSAGVVTFSGATKTFNASGANPGISLTSNTGAVINFTNGGLAVTSTTGNAFEATGGGIINVAGNGNMLSNTSGIALNVLNTTIAATGLTFQSINSNGGVNGIVLNNTGTSGGLTVTGVGTTAGSGGTIQNKTGDGIRLESTQNHMLNHMNLTSTASNNGPGPCGNDVTGNTGCNAAINMLAVANVTLTGINISGGQQYGINGNGVSGINFTGLTVSGSGNEPEEDGIRFFNLSGSCRIRNTTVQNSFSNNVRIYNNAPTPLLMFIDEDVANTSRYLNALNDDGMRFEATNMANIAMNVFDTDFDSSDGDHIQAAIGDSAGMVLNFSNNTMIATNATVLGSGITLNSGGNFSGSMTFDVTGNTINGANAKAINVNQGTTTLDGGTGTISGNIINN